MLAISQTKSQLEQKKKKISSPNIFSAVKVNIKMRFIDPNTLCGLFTRWMFDAGLVICSLRST